jgi:hypothetical protein
MWDWYSGTIVEFICEKVWIVYIVDLERHWLVTLSFPKVDIGTVDIFMIQYDIEFSRSGHWHLIYDL